MIIEQEERVTEAVLASISGDTNPRRQAVLGALVRHLHAFLREVRLTEAELEYAFDFLNRIGQQSSDTHNEAALFSDALGASTLVCLLNNGMTGATETGAALLGPFWRLNAPKLPNGASLLRSETPGRPLEVQGVVQTRDGTPLPGARVDIWQASPKGLYENQDPEQADMNLRGTLTADDAGRVWFRTVEPAGYPVPMDGPTGEMLRAQNRQPFRPAHLHFLVYHEGYQTLITQIFPQDTPHLTDDPVFGVTPALMGEIRLIDAGTPHEHARLDYIFTLQPGTARLPTPPIK